MTPIVNGLEEQYVDQIDFQLLDASLGEGKRLFDHFGLVGHPSYILLDSAGEERWRGIGPIEMNLLEGEISILIDQ